MSDFFQPSYWPTNERLKMLTLLLFDVQTRMRGQIGVEFDQESTCDVGFFPALLLAKQSEAEIANFLLS